MGSGPALLIPPAYITHLEFWSEAPGAREFLHCLAQHRKLVLYDRHGCGLSDRHRTDFTIEDDMQDMYAVVQALGVQDLDILGISAGTGPAILFAVSQPGELRRLVLYGSGLGRPTRELSDAMDRLLSVDPDFYMRGVAARLFGSSLDEPTYQSFLRHSRMAASNEVRLGLLPRPSHMKIEPFLPRIQAPTLVLHRRDDPMPPFEGARDLASMIPNAHFLPLEGDAHLPWAGDWLSVAKPSLAFLLGDDSSQRIQASSTDDDENGAGSHSSATQANRRAGKLTPREMEVLQLIAKGRTNKEISTSLVLSERTVARHITNIYAKIDARSKAEATAYAIFNGLA
jgi:pimeloyl-ACP methyl ester carboxylesterase/DNA-binding CsgD family transcriptional regulator